MTRILKILHTPLYISVLLLAMLSGCETTPEGPRPELVNPEAAAIAYLSQGLLKAAANEYLRLAESVDAGQRAEYLMKAAFVLSEAGEPLAARRLLDQIDVATIPARLQLRRSLLLAELSLLDHDWQTTLDLLPEENAPKYPGKLRARMFELRALAFQQAGNFLDSARERINMESVLTETEDIAENRRLIWEAISTISPQKLDNAGVSGPDVFGGWLELGRIAARYEFDPRALRQLLQSWQTTYLNHPATSEIVPTLLYVSELEAKPPLRIALLLPFDGPFEQAAQAIRDGFIAAWFTDQRDHRPQILVRDTTKLNIATALAQASEEGVDLVVGPLRKNLVSELANQTKLPVTTLALNYSDEASTQSDSQTAGAQLMTTDGLYQFALSPESEAQQAAERAWFDGAGRAAVITPDGEWGHRVAASFKLAWATLGGEVVSQETYPSDAKDLGGPVKLLLNVNSSEARFKDLSRVVHRKLFHEPRRRQDVDMVFMAGFPNQARRLRPQLRFHQASEVPVYTTSHVYNGVSDPPADRDINGVIFGDMPWVLRKDDFVLREKVEGLWPKASAVYLRLYAFGADAYQVIPHLGRLQARPHAEIPGYSGALSVNKRQQVVRRLEWAKFIDGVAVPIGQDLSSP